MLALKSPYGEWSINLFEQGRSPKSVTQQGKRSVNRGGIEVILVIQTDEAFSVKAGWYLSALDNVFLAIYFMETVVKLYALRSFFFTTGWNIMDFLIVLFTMVDFLLPLIVQNVGSFDVAAIFRLLRMFRAIRALRALRVLRTISRRVGTDYFLGYTSLISFAECITPVDFLTKRYIDMFAVIGRGLFYEVAPSRFGTLGKAFFTLFQLITLDDWFFMYSDVVEKNPGYGYIIFYLIVYIVLENFIFMNLFVAVLVDNFQRTITAVEKPHKKHSGIQYKSVFEDAKLDERGRAYSFSDNSYSELEVSVDEEEEEEDSDIGIAKKVEDYYPENKFSAR
ncbi:Cation channel sperm-associated protein 1 [Stylophora pistillata]|uniref:Cation channel sperm-associated protein 1 n=1 Tax=Stylophora pistillata TaxID=50429 RepID=A0A2B4RS24_STYPI|nr:Cation channel sperm-associated protein 1 [Stylophora pistillata]